MTVIVAHEIYNKWKFSYAHLCQPTFANYMRIEGFIDVLETLELLVQ